VTVPDAGSRLTAELLAAACPGFKDDGCAGSGTPAHQTSIPHHVQHDAQEAHAQNILACSAKLDHNANLAVVAAC